MEKDIELAEPNVTITCGRCGLKERITQETLEQERARALADGHLEVAGEPEAYLCDRCWPIYMAWLAAERN